MFKGGIYWQDIILQLSSIRPLKNDNRNSNVRFRVFWSPTSKPSSYFGGILHYKRPQPLLEAELDKPSLTLGPADLD